MLTKWEKYFFPLLYKNSYTTKVKGKKIIICDTWNLSSLHRQKDIKRYHCKSLEERRLLTRSAVLKVWSEYQKGFWDPFCTGVGKCSPKAIFIIILNYCLFYSLSWELSGHLPTCVLYHNRMNTETHMRTYLFSIKLEIRNLENYKN